MRKSKRSCKRNRRGGSAFTSSYANADGLQTTGSSNYAAAPNDAAVSSSAPVSTPLKGGQGRSQMKSRGRGRGRSQGIGGYWAAVLEQAIVPLTLLGIQQTYGRKRHLKERTFKRRR
jgi:hypothetical protein